MDVHTARKLLGNPYAYLNDEGGFDWDDNGDREVSVHEALLATSDQVSKDRSRLSNTWAHVDGDGNLSALFPRKPEVLGTKKKGDQFTEREIGEIARRLQLTMWDQRNVIWSNRENLEPVDILDPIQALQLLRYRVEEKDTLGQHSLNGKVLEIAGTVNDDEYLVELSKKFPPEVFNFTAAHELGHAVLHRAIGLHRDRPRDGSEKTKDKLEREADIFAASFLMPEKQVRQAFKSIFFVDQLLISEETAFGLTYDSEVVFRNRYPTGRTRARLLASTGHYAGNHFHSLAHQFRVSVEAMAIRLEELKLFT